MTHPITPPPELVDKWLTEVDKWLTEPEYGSPGLTTLHTFSKPRLTQMLTRAAQWGADQELAACCEWLDHKNWWGESNHLRAARRPKPPSLKQQAQAALLRLANESNDLASEEAADMETIRRALEALPDA